MYILSVDLFISIESIRQLVRIKCKCLKLFFKVVLRLKDEPKAIGFICRNASAKGHKKTDYVNTVDEVERITGMDFFSQLPDNIEQVIESQANIKEWY